jgi:FkbH-like protein
VNPSELRQEIDRLIESADAAQAVRLLAELWRGDNTNSAASFLVSRYERLRPKLNLLPYRLSILRSFTVEPMLPLLRAAAFLAGLDLTVHLSDFNAHVQEIIDPASALHRFSPGAAILAVQTRDVAPDLWRDFSCLTAEQVQEAIDRVTGEFRAWMQAFRQHNQAHLIVHNLEQPEVPNRGALDGQSSASQSEAIGQINRELRSIAAETGAYVLDYDALVSRHGRQAWHDERKWLTVRLPIAASHLHHMVEEWMRFLHPLAMKIAKALVVDLDNTLWGGVIGEDGMAGIQLGPEYPGAAYQEMQRALLDLHHRGILLAVCSKNNHDDAMEAIERHPGMLLKSSHFAAIRINWADKAQNLREIAAELKIGVDALAFLDDNPIECQLVRAELPDVFVIDMPREPMELARAVRVCPVFERLSISAEDQQRGAYYQSQREREQAEQSISSREDFYRSLQQEAEISPLTTATLARVAQLTNKTNQFNLTTRRYNEQQITAMVANPGWNCFSIRVKDRFGDNGLVGVAIMHTQDAICEIDTFLLSCRVIGRTVETAFLSFLAHRAQAQGARQVQGWFLPTGKNAPARDFYSSHGFTVVKRNGEATLWRLDLSHEVPQCPQWVGLHIVDGDNG